MKPEAYVNLILDGDAYHHCTDFETCMTHDKAMYHIVTLQNALDLMPKVTWGDCCDKAAASMGKLLALKFKDAQSNDGGFCFEYIIPLTIHRE